MSLFAKTSVQDDAKMGEVKVQNSALFLSVLFLYIKKSIYTDTNIYIYIEPFFT